MFFNLSIYFWEVFASFGILHATACMKRIMRRFLSANQLFKLNNNNNNNYNNNNNNNNHNIMIIIIIIINGQNNVPFT